MVDTIRVDALKIRRSNKTILDIPQLTIDERPTLLLGANGAGKSTLFPPWHQILLGTTGSS